MTTATLTVLGLMLVLFGSCCYLYLTCSTVDNASFATSGSSSWASNGISEGTSGELFRAVHVHTFSGERLFAAWKPPSTPAPGRSPCKMWAVITSIFAPTTTVKQIASLKDWCLVIAGDKKSPREYNVSGERTHYLSPDAQERLPFATSKMLRWNHFGRKNLGYLYAIEQGARWVYDTDDDNELQSLAYGIPIPRPSTSVEEVDTAHPLYNLYPQTSTNPHAWPRGFPLDSIKDNRTFTAAIEPRAWTARRVGVIQSLADHDPDVDGIYRLTQPLPFVFPAATAIATMATGAAIPQAADRGRQLHEFPTRVAGSIGEARRLRGRGIAGGAQGSGKAGGDGKGSGKASGDGKGSGEGNAAGRAAASATKFADKSEPHHYRYRLISLRAGTFMPYNAQATLHGYESLWGLLLPCTVHGRVADIWRAYFTQRLLWDVGLRTAFSTPWVTQYRNVHNYLADFNSELPLYQQAGELVRVLREWRPMTPSLPGRIEELYILMYEMGILGLNDVKLVQAWLTDLVKLGYEFPEIGPRTAGWLKD